MDADEAAQAIVAPIAASRARSARPCALVAGAFGGIGSATVRALARAGFEVYAGGWGAKRRVSMFGTEANIRPIELDVASAESVATAVHAAGDELRVVVSCAGFALVASAYDLEDEDLRHYFEANIMGPARLARACIPQFLDRGEGRFIQVAPTVGRGGWIGRAPASAAQAAVTRYTDALRAELRDAASDVHAILVQTRGVRSGWAANARLAYAQRLPKGSDPGLPDRVYDAMLRENAAGMPPERVARTIVSAATAKRPSARYVVGPAARFEALADAFAPTRILDRFANRALRL